MIVLGGLRQRRALLSLTSAVCCVTIGCTQNTGTVTYADVAQRYEQHIKRGELVEAVIEYQHAATLEYYNIHTGRRDGFAPNLVSLRPLLRELALPENIDQLVELASMAPALSEAANDLQRLLARMLSRPAGTSLEDLTSYYRRNRRRLDWSPETRTFVLDADDLIGPGLPAGLEPIADAGLSPDGLPLRVRCKVDGMEMVYVPPGAYQAEGIVGDVIEGAGPFYVDRYEVSNRQYTAFLVASGRPAHQHVRQIGPKTMPLPQLSAPELPVTCVSIEDARAYAAWAGKRIPNEGEWLRAALDEGRTPFPWGDAPPQSDREQYAVFGREWPERGGAPAPVGGRTAGASSHGTEDMAGNVAELVVDEFRSGAAIVAGDSYRDAWPMQIDWRNLDPLGTSGDQPPAAPWVGFRCVKRLAAATEPGE